MIKYIKRKFLGILSSNGFIWGVDFGVYWKQYRQFKQDFKSFEKLDGEKRLSMRWEDRYPCLKDKTNTTPYDRHYIYHPAWAARVLSKIKPVKHIDFSSTLTFSSIMSAFINVEFYDYRPANLTLSNLTSKSADLTSLPFNDGQILSASCMHVIEHIGLGRYGDPIDPEGDLKAIAELRRVIGPNGDLLIVVPVGAPKIQFNAHRVYSRQLIEGLFPDFDLIEFLLITDDDNEVHTIANASETIVQSQRYGCGCFWFKKRNDNK